jgi:hypothetical protein
MMAVTYKRLASNVAYSGNNQYYYLIYSVPENKSVIVTSIIFCNLKTDVDVGISGLASCNGYINLVILESFDPLSLTYPSSLSINPKDYILRKSFISPMETKDFKSGLTLEYGQHILVQSQNVVGGSTAGGTISINIFGSENI